MYELGRGGGLVDSLSAAESASTAVCEVLCECQGGREPFSRSHCSTRTGPEVRAEWRLPRSDLEGDAGVCGAEVLRQMPSQVESRALAKTGLSLILSPERREDWRGAGQ